MSDSLDDRNIESEIPLVTPNQLMSEFPLNTDNRKFILEQRQRARDVIHGVSDEVLVIVGPCSIHDVEEAKEYADALQEMIKKHEGVLHIVARTYFEKPRTTVGWKGLINDPYLNETHDINEGLRLARGLLSYLTNIGVACSTEFLDTNTPQYIADMITWGAIGARNVEAQGSRELASGLSMPIGMKNNTSGSRVPAFDAMEAAKHSHRFPSIGKNGMPAIFTTRGNCDTHIILRGGGGKTNYDQSSIHETVEEAKERGFKQSVMVDASHANSEKKYENQPRVIEEVARQIHDGSPNIMGVMLESYIREGFQKIGGEATLERGVSITDSCISIDTTRGVLDVLAEAARTRRNKK